MRDAVERWLEAEREQLPLWIPVMLGSGVAAWFVLPTPALWLAAALALTALAMAGLAAGHGGRAGRAVTIGALCAAAGLALADWRAEREASPVLAGPTIATFEAKVESVEPLTARDLVRLTLAPAAGAGLPSRVRVNLAVADVPAGLTRGATIKLGARLMPPPQPAVPGAYDFARVAWFSKIGGTGRGFAPVAIIAPGETDNGLRASLTAHITARLEGSAGGIAAALATGDEGAITQDDSDAMRRAGLAHLLSVSGLHITAAVAATMLLTLRLLALSPWLALRVRLPLVAGAAGAAAAIGYTLLTGSQVPTIRSCVASLLVLAALALGREALTLRLVAAGATIVMLVWPEALIGPSFQLSFAAITAIVALHEHPRVQGWFALHEEPRWRRLLRSGGSLLVTGLVVEIALMPIAVYHFHKAGLYGAAANIVAIPLTTFVIMPLEAGALLFDVAGLGAPWWWATRQAMRALLWLAHAVADAPGSVASLPAMPDGAFALMVAGGLWLALWRTRVRWAGAIPLAIGAVWALATPAPDLLVTGDGRHAAIRVGQGLAILRDRAGDYTRDTLAENGGLDGEPLLLAEQADARCSRDLCLTDVVRGSRTWRILATRSAYLVPVADLIAACGKADVVISERNLPRRCQPRWLRLDKATLAKTGGVAVTLTDEAVTTVLDPADRHPWRVPPTLPRTGSSLSRSGAGSPTAYPARGRGREDSAADHRRGWQDRAGSSRPRDGSI